VPIPLLLIAGIAAVAVGAVATYWALRQAKDACDRDFTDKPVGATKQACPVGSRAAPLSEAQAQRVFAELAAMKHIPFDYPDDCCYSRAHEMCRIMQQQGVDCRKVWNYGHGLSSKEASLTVETPNHPSGQVRWLYHVAPVVGVRGNEGETKDMVLDPSMFDRPVDVQQWVDKQGDPSSTHEISQSNYYYRAPGGFGGQEDPDYTQTTKMLKEHRYYSDLRKASPR
jgi:hypothetical protein